MEEPKLECVQICQGMLLADLLKSKLVAAGIPVLLRYESAGPVFGITVDGLGAVRLMVPADHAAEARRLLTQPAEELGEAVEEEPCDEPPKSVGGKNLFCS